MGGAINLVRSSLSLTGRTVFDGNSAGCFSGAINAAGENVLDVTEDPILNGYSIEGKKNVIFKNNWAPDVGAIGIWYYEEVKITDALFENNSALGNGAVSCTIDIYFCDFALRSQDS